MQSPEDVENEGFKDRCQWNRNSPGYMIGMTEYLRSDFLTIIGDFILQDNSPHYRTSEYRIQMGTYYNQPDFEKALLLITIMMSDNELKNVYPLSEEAL